MPRNIRERPDAWCNADIADRGTFALACFLVIESDMVGRRVIERLDYGQDAPAVVHGLAIGGGLLTVTALLMYRLRPDFGLYPFLALPPAVSFLATAAWMVWSSRVGKQRMIRDLLDRYNWRGDEAVLDIGCGHGLATIAAARRINQAGRVVGIDMWRSQDLAGNTLEAARANAKAAGVEARVLFMTGDATKLPFADATFDVVTSTTTFHNLPSAGRYEAIREALRVLHPGGTLLIYDILHTRKYAAWAKARGADVRLSRMVVLWALPGWSMIAKAAVSPTSLSE